MSRDPTNAASGAPQPRWLVWLAVTLAVAVAYAPAPWGGLVWDDPILVENQLPRFRGLGDALWPPANVDQWSDNYYRPVVTLSYLLDRTLYGQEPAGMHVTNLLLHLGVSLALLALLMRLLTSQPAGAAGALAGALLFAVHPLHTETVSWITGRSDALAGLFLVPAALLALRWRDRRGLLALGGCGACFALALLSKEAALAGLVLLPLLLLLAPHPAGGQRARVTTTQWTGLAAVLTASLAAAAWLRQSAGAAAAGSGLGLPSADPALALQALAWYLMKMLWPWPQSIFQPPGALPTLPASAAIATLLALAGLWALRRWWRANDGLSLLALAWFALALAPALAATLLAVAETPVAERQLYLPSVALSLGVAPAVASCIATWPARRGWTLTATGALLAVFTASTVARGLVWLDNERLWTDAVAKAPGHGLPLNELAVALATRGEVDRAAGLWERARALDNTPENAGIIDANLGNVALRRGDSAQAQRYFAAAIGHFWNLPDAHRGLGRVLAMEARTAADGDAALALLRRAQLHLATAVELRPTDIGARAEYEALLAQFNRLERAGAL